MYSQLIKRSRLYLELKNEYNKRMRNQRNKHMIQGLEKQKIQQRSVFYVNQFLQSYNNRSLLLTKQNLIQLIKYLHEENVALTGVKRAKNSDNKIQQQQIQKQQEQIQQLRLRKQLYEKQLKEKTKIMRDLKVKVQACQQYLLQVRGSIINNQEIKNNKCVMNKQSSQKKIVRKQQADIIKVQLYQNEQQKSQILYDESVMMQLINGFQLIKQKNSINNSKSFNNNNNHNEYQKGSLSQKDNSFLNSLKRAKPQQKSKLKKNEQDSSSSLIQTSSFIANYYRPHVGGSGLSSSIREILQNNSDDDDGDLSQGIDKQKKSNNNDNEKIIKQQDSQLETERKKDQGMSQKSLFYRNNMMTREFNRQQIQKLPKSDSSQQSSIEKQEQSIKNEQKQQKINYSSTIQDKSKPINFLNVLNKFNNKK